MKRYTRKKVGGVKKPKGFKKFDVVHVFKNEEHTGSYEMAVLFSRKHRDGTFTVQYEDGSQGDIPETDLVLVNRFHRTPQEIKKIHKEVIRYILLVDKTLNYNRKNRINRYPDGQLSRLKEKLGPEYHGKIRFALFSGKPLNENVANLIACNKNYGDVGECPFSPEYDDISSPISEDTIINHYNDRAAERAAVDSVPSPVPSPPKKSPSKRTSGKHSSGKHSSGKHSSGKHSSGKHSNSMGRARHSSGTRSNSMGGARRSSAKHSNRKGGARRSSGKRSSATRRD